MRGSDERAGLLFGYVGVEGRLRPDHPQRAVRALTDETLAAMERELSVLYAGSGRPSIAPQRPRCFAAASIASGNQAVGLGPRSIARPVIPTATATELETSLSGATTPVVRDALEAVLGAAHGLGHRRRLAPTPAARRPPIVAAISNGAAGASAMRV